MRKLILFLLVFASAKVSAQVYQLMPQYGYQAPRFAIDSTLQIPTVCGVPTLKSVQFVTKKGAIAYDSCNAVFYTYNPKTQTWSAVSGGGGGANDTTSLSNRINLKLNISDTASMLNPYLRKIDTTNKFVSSVTSLNDSTIRVIKGTTTNDITIRSSATVTNATRLITTVYNNSGVTITKGTVVYINGRHSSNFPTVLPAQANSEQNSYKTFAIVDANILNNATGIVIQAGNITELNLPTSTFTDGDIVYLSPLVLGGITNVKPLAPNHICKLGSVTRAHPTFGSIEIKIENGWQLDELSDVSIPLVPADSVLLQFSRVDSLWHDVTINNAIGNRYIKPTDTTVFQRKSLSAYTIMANNTSATANATAQAFKDTSGTYTGTITWAGTAPTSGNLTYRWTRIGKMVTINIALVYANAGTTNNQVIVTLPADAPTPTKPTGLTSASNMLYPALTQINATNQSTLTSSTMRSMLRSNSGNNGFEFFIQCGATSAVNAFITCTYFTD